MDQKALFKVGYGLYVLTARYAGRDNGCIINTVLQVTGAPDVVGVIAVNKQNYTHDMIVKSKEFNVSILTEETPFEVFERFGFQSGGTVDKFAGFPEAARSANGLLYVPGYSNAYLSFQVADTLDFGSHTMFRSKLVDGEVIGNADSVTYTYYQRKIKPKPLTTPKKGYRCSVCGYVYEGEHLPADFICPWCKHGVESFTEL